MTNSDGVPDVYAGVPGGCFQQCLSCKKVTVGNPGALECPYCGHKKLVESYKAWPVVEKVCKKCRDNDPESIKIVEKGGAYLVCKDCGDISVLYPFWWTAKLRKDLGLKKTGWAQAEITYNQCAYCNPLVIDDCYTIKKGEAVFKGPSPDRYKVVHGKVSKSSDHVVVSHDDINNKSKRVPLARLAPGAGKNIHIQYLVPENPEDDKTANIMGDMKQAIERVAQGVKANPWPQLKKLGSAKTMSKSKVHWEYQKAVVK